ncbi:MAG TPA: queuosine precursor transporter [Allosphingosinicella sp.]|nr:queuosine precursor transporter [Allosphingosinicella sp.]
MARRALTEGERELVRAAFGDRIRFDRIGIRHGAGGNPLAWLAFRSPRTDAITLIRTIFFKGAPVADFSKAGDKHLFMHEMTHVWQYQALGVVPFYLRYAWQFVRSGFSQAEMYTYKKGDAFAAAKLEAQADMVRDYGKGGERREKAAPGLAGTGLYGLEQDAPAVRAIDASALAGRPLRYFDFLMAAFVTVLLLSNVLGAGKVSAIELPGIGLWPFGAGILFFPISYVIGDVLTEVYGFARARRCIWAGFAAMLFMAFMAFVVVALPPSPDWTGQAAYEAVFGQVPRIVFASIVAFWAGEFVNSYVLARMKLWTKGRHLWTRTIGSTVAGQGVDSLIFYPLAFWGAEGWTNALVVKVLLTQWALKVGWEALLTPVTYAVVGWLKRREGIDVYDEGTDFTPFRAKV